MDKCQRQTLLCESKKLSVSHCARLGVYCIMTPWHQHCYLWQKKGGGPLFQSLSIPIRMSYIRQRDVQVGGQVTAAHSFCIAFSLQISMNERAMPFALLLPSAPTTYGACHIGLAPLEFKNQFWDIFRASSYHIGPPPSSIVVRASARGAGGRGSSHHVTPKTLKMGGLRFSAWRLALMS